MRKWFSLKELLLLYIRKLTNEQTQVTFQKYFPLIKNWGHFSFILLYLIHLFDKYLLNSLLCAKHCTKSWENKCRDWNGYCPSLHRTCGTRDAFILMGIGHALKDFFKIRISVMLWRGKLTIYVCFLFYAYVISFCAFHSIYHHVCHESLYQTHLPLLNNCLKVYLLEIVSVF